MSNYKQLLEQRALLDGKIKDARQVEVGHAIAQAKQLIAEHGLTAADLGFKASGFAAGAKPRTAVAVKYRGPDGQTWSGRGRAPNWLTGLEAQGRDRQDFLVSP